MKKTGFFLVLLTCYALDTLTLPGRQISDQKAVIFDMGNVLVESAKLEAFRVTGPHHFAWYFSGNPRMVFGSTEKIRCHLLYPFLRNCMPYETDSSPVYDEFNQRMPQLMIEWMTGRMSARLARAICQEKCALYSSWFANNAEQHLLRALTMVMFTPQHLVHIQKLIPKSVDFVRMCKQSGYQVYILSNWDAESFGELIKKDPAFFALFDGTVISGSCGCVKPDRTIYEHLLKTYNLNPKNCFFIDDVIQNVQAARTVGITAAQCTGCDIDTIKPAFYAWQQSAMS